jgi:hypothetical protein
MQPAMLQKAYTKRQATIARLKEQAQAFGLTIREMEQEAQPPPLPQSPPPPQVPSKVQAHATPLMAQEIVRKPAPFDGAAVAKPQRVACVPDEPEAPRHEAYAMGDQAPKIISTEAQQAVRADGLPINVPRKIVSTAGVTDVAIVNTGGDVALQQRFKALKTEQDSNPDAHIFGRDGYTVRDCTLCRGTGKARIGGQACQKCQGTGLAKQE